MTSSPDTITSRDNPLIKELRRLSQDGSNYRKTGRVWIEGEHLCEAAHGKGQTIHICLISDQKQHLAQAECARAAIKLIVVADALMKEISGLESPAGMGAVLQLPPEWSVDRSARTVVLDRLQDPGNVGSILRSAAAFGYQQIMALKGSVALWSPKVLRAGMGAHFSLRLIEGASAEDVAQLSLPLAATSSHAGMGLHEMSRAPVNWLMGHEGQGVQPALMQRAQLQVRIAQPGGEESLNVAAAAAIVLHASSVFHPSKN
jgi:RNA methyltransferase, TrmH family